MTEWVAQNIIEIAATLLAAGVTAGIGFAIRVMQQLARHANEVTRHNRRARRFYRAVANEFKRNDAFHTVIAEQCDADLARVRVLEAERGVKDMAELVACEEELYGD